MNDEHDLTRRTTLYGIASTGFLPLAGLQGGTLESQQDETGTDNSGSSLPPLAWEWTDDTSDGDQVVQDLVETQDGAIVCAGIEGDESGVQNVLLRKIDNTGEAIWSRTLGGDRNDAALGVQEAADGTLVLCGGSMSESSNLMDTTVWLTDADGTLERSISFGRPGTNDAAHAITSGSNGYVLGGGTHYLGGAFGDGVGRFVKIDDDGAEEWSTTVGGGHAGEIYDVTTTSGGQYAFVGTRAGDDGEGRAWLGVVDRTGDLEWSRTYGASGSRIGYSLVETDDGGFAFAGTTQPPGQDEPRAWVVKVDLRGDLEWERTYGGTGHDALVSIDKAIDGGYVLAGWTEDEDDGNMGWLLHVGDDGELEGEKTYNGDADGRFNTVIQTGYGYTGGGLTTPPGESSSAWALGVSEDADRPEIDSTSIEINPYPIEQGERPTISVDIDGAEEARVVAQYTSEASNPTEATHSMTDPGNGRWISSQLPPIENVGWVDVTIEAENEAGATATADTFTIDGPTDGQDDWLIEDRTLGYHVFEYVADVAVVVGRFADEDPPSGRERDVLEAWKRARERDTNVYYGSGRGLRGAIGFRMTFYDNDNRFYEVTDTRAEYEGRIGDRGFSRTATSFMGDLLSAAESDINSIEYDFWIGTHRGRSVSDRVLGLHRSDAPLILDEFVYAPTKTITPPDEEVNLLDDYKITHLIWLHEIGHACGLDHPNDYGNDDNKCIMTNTSMLRLEAWRRDPTEVVNPVSPMSTLQLLSESIGINTTGSLDRRQDWLSIENIRDSQLGSDWLGDEIRVQGLQGYNKGDSVPIVTVDGADQKYVFEARGHIEHAIHLADGPDGLVDRIKNLFRSDPERELTWSSDGGAVVVYNWEDGLLNPSYNIVTETPDGDDNLSYSFLGSTKERLRDRISVADERWIEFKVEEMRQEETVDPATFWASVNVRMTAGESNRRVYTLQDSSGIPDPLRITACADYTPPSLDLKAVDSEGRVSGVNEEGEYVNEIPGASASGKRIQGTEWISVPEDTNVEIRVSSWDMDQFIEDVQELGTSRTENEEQEVTVEDLEAELTVEYSLSQTEYGRNPELIEEEGETIVVDARTKITEGEIEPGTETEINQDELEVVYDRLQDGPLDRLPDPEYIAGGGAVTVGLFYLTYRMLSDNQENGE